MVRRPRSHATVLAMTLALALALPASGSTIDPGTIVSEEDEYALELALQKRVNALISEKNEDGKTYKRGIYSRSFRRLDETTYQVSFHKDTVDGDTLVTERYLLILKVDGRKAEIVDEELQDTYRGLTRSLPGDEDFFDFERFTFEREGLKVTASSGNLVKDYRAGKTDAILLVADDISYEYEPPIKQDQEIWEIAVRRHPEDLVLKPHQVSIKCEEVDCEELLSSCFEGVEETTLDEAHREFQMVYRDLLKEQAHDRKEFPFSGFRLTPEEGHRRYSVAIKKQGAPEKWVGLTYDSFRGKPVSFWSSEMGTMFAYHPEEVRNSDVSLLSLERRDDVGGRDYDMEGLRGTVELAIGDPEAMTGDILYSLRAKRPLSELQFFIARLWSQGERQEAKNPKLRVNSVQDAGGQELTWVRTGSFSGIVVLPEEVPEDGEITLRMQFENRDVIEKFTASHSYMSRGGWLPFVRFGDMIPLFDLTVKVPSRYTVLGIGQKVSEETVGGVSITRWVAQNAVDFPTVIFGTYETATSKVKATRIDGTEIPVTVHVDKDTMGNRSMAVEGRDASDLVDGGDMGDRVSFAVDSGRISPSKLPEIAKEAANSLNFFRELFGVDYPYGKLDLVNDPLGFLYGQAPSSIVYLGVGAFFGEGTLAGMANQRGSDYNFFTKGLVPHEVAHQWWGSLIANANSRNYWFVESIAEYSAALFIEAAYGKSDYDDHVAAWRSEIMDHEPMNAVQAGYTVWQGDLRGTRTALYAKGPYAFHILRETVGDEKLFKFLKQLAQELEGEEIVTRDIQLVMEKSLGGGMEWFFDQWIRGVGTPELTVSYSTRALEDGTYMVEGEVTQRVVLGKDRDVLEGQYFQGVVPLTVEFSKKEHARLPIVLKGERTPFQFKVPKKPRKVIVNKDGEFLARLKVEKG